MRVLVRVWDGDVIEFDVQVLGGKVYTAASAEERMPDQPCKTTNKTRV